MKTNMIKNRLAFLLVIAFIQLNSFSAFAEVIVHDSIAPSTGGGLLAGIPVRTTSIVADSTGKTGYSRGFGTREYRLVEMTELEQVRGLITSNKELSPEQEARIKELIKEAISETQNQH